MVYGIGSRGKNKLSFFQPLFLLDVVLYQKAGKEIQKVKEFRLNPPLQHISSDIRKGTLALFLSEVLSRSIREESTDPELFHFLVTTIQMLDGLHEGLSIFHLVFLIKLTRYLGFAPGSDGLDSGYFDLKEGHLFTEKPNHSHFLSPEKYQQLNKLNQLAFNQMATIQLSVQERDHLLESILTLYRFHIPNFSTLKSYEVLKQVFS